MNSPQRDTVEFVSAVVLGAALGYAGARLIAPDRSPTARFRRRLRKPGRRVRGRADAAGTAGRVTARTTGRLARELGAFAGELLVATREELLDEALRRLGLTRGSSRRKRGLSGLAARMPLRGD